MGNAQQMHTASKRSEIDGEIARQWAERRKGAQDKTVDTASQRQFFCVWWVAVMKILRKYSGSGEELRGTKDVTFMSGEKIGGMQGFYTRGDTNIRGRSSVFSCSTVRLRSLRGTRRVGTVNTSASDCGTVEHMRSFNFPSSTTWLGAQKNGERLHHCCERVGAEIRLHKELLERNHNGDMTKGDGTKYMQTDSRHLVKRTDNWAVPGVWKFNRCRDRPRSEPWISIIYAPKLIPLSSPLKQIEIKSKRQCHCF
jgi:hypothetical protein